jgi:hypothetical protein
MQFFHENSQIVSFFVELKWKFSLQLFLKEAEVGRLDEVNLNDSKGPTEATEATEAALHEAQLEDALPTEVKLPAGKLIRQCC